MSIDINTLSAKELESLISQAKKRKTVLNKRKPLATVRSRLMRLIKAEEGVEGACRDLDEGFLRLHLDGADLVLGDVAVAAEHRDQPARLSTLAAANRHGEPLARTQFGTRARRGLDGGAASFRCRTAAQASTPNTCRA